MNANPLCDALSCIHWQLKIYWPRHNCRERREHDQNWHPFWLVVQATNRGVISMSAQRTGKPTTVVRNMGVMGLPPSTSFGEAQQIRFGS